MFIFALAVTMTTVTMGKAVAVKADTITESGVYSKSDYVKVTSKANGCTIDFSPYIKEYNEYSYGETTVTLKVGG